MIINQGKLVAEDTPENLTARLQGYETMHVLAEGPEREVRERLSRVAGVNSVSTTPGSNGRVELAIQTSKGRDVRKELARAIVESGWGLLELRPVGLSLEDIFLKLTTKETEEQPEKVAEPVS